MLTFPPQSGYSAPAAETKAVGTANPKLLGARKAAPVHRLAAFLLRVMATPSRAAMREALSLPVPSSRFCNPFGLPALFANGEAGSKTFTRNQP